MVPTVKCFVFWFGGPNQLVLQRGGDLLIGLLACSPLWWPLTIHINVLRMCRTEESFWIKIWMVMAGGLTTRLLFSFFPMWKILQIELYLRWSVLFFMFCSKEVEIQVVNVSLHGFEFNGNSYVLRIWILEANIHVHLLGTKIFDSSFYFFDKAEDWHLMQL